MKIARSDFLKVLDALEAAALFFVARDEMNGAVHLAGNKIRYSPLTSTVLAQKERMATLLNEQTNEPHD